LDIINRYFAGALYPYGSFILQRSRAERSKDHNKATTVTPKLQHKERYTNRCKLHWACTKM